MDENDIKRCESAIKREEDIEIKLDATLKVRRVIKDIALLAMGFEGFAERRNVRVSLSKK